MNNLITNIKSNSIQIIMPIIFISYFIIMLHIAL